MASAKKGQACRGKGIHAISRWCKDKLRGEDRRMFWKMHRTAEDAEIRAQLAELYHDDDFEDWDVRIENPPTRPTEQVMVRFVEGRYRPPNIVEDPAC